MPYNAEIESLADLFEALRVFVKGPGQCAE